MAAPKVNGRLHLKGVPQKPPASLTLENWHISGCQKKLIASIIPLLINIKDGYIGYLSQKSGKFS